MKLALSNLDKILECCTGKEIDLIIYLGQYQDESGIVGGIYYRQVMKDIGISESAFYKCLYSLETKGIINIKGEHEHRYWTISILNNDFSCCDEYKKGYINLNYEILHDLDFRASSRSEKVIILQILRLMNLHIKKDFMTISYDALIKWTDKSLRSVKKIVKRLSKILKITVSIGKILVDHRHRLPNRREEKEVHVRNAHIVAYVLHKTKVEANQEDFFDALIVLKQYKVKSFLKVKNIVMEAIKSCGYLCARWINAALNIDKKGIKSSGRRVKLA